MKLLGSPKDWKFNEMELLRISEIPPYLIHQVNEDFLRNVYNDLDKVTNASQVFRVCVDVRICSAQKGIQH